MFEIKYEEIIQENSKNILVNIELKNKINFNVIFTKNQDGDLCAYIDKSVNSQIIYFLNLANPSFGFMINMFLQMYQQLTYLI